MIKSVKIRDGYAKELPITSVLAKTKLSDGLNILWGANGCGKTSVLKIIAAHTFCYSGGWTRLLDPMELHGLRMDNKGPKLPQDLSHQSPGKCKATLTWDLAPVFFANGVDKSEMGAFTEKARDSSDGITSPMEIIHNRLTPSSSGQTRTGKLNKILDLLQSAPDFKNIKLQRGLNSTWEASLQTQIDYLKNRPDDSRVTVLFDEPEQHLDIQKAHKLWGEIIPHVAKYAQVIVATHSPLALQYLESANWISPEADDAKTSLAIYQKVLNISSQTK